MKKLVLLAAVTMLVWNGKLQAGFIPFAKDTLTWNKDLVGQGAWVGPGTKLKYTVRRGTAELGPNEAGKWRYNYTLTVPGEDISQVIIEVSSSFKKRNIIEDITPNTKEGELGIYRATEPNNPNPTIPEDLYGIKWELPGNGSTFTVSLISDRGPMWGDFFAKDDRDRSNGNNNGRIPFVNNKNGVNKDKGPRNGPFISLWNAGFTSQDKDPSLDLAKFDPAHELEGNHLLVPDTTTGGSGSQHLIPESDTLVLLSLGLISMQALFFRRWMGRASL